MLKSDSIFGPQVLYSSKKKSLSPISRNALRGGCRAVKVGDRLFLGEYIALQALGVRTLSRFFGYRGLIIDLDRWDEKKQAMFRANMVSLPQ